MRTKVSILIGLLFALVTLFFLQKYDLFRPSEQQDIDHIEKKLNYVEKQIEDIKTKDKETTQIIKKDISEIQNEESIFINKNLISIIDVTVKLLIGVAGLFFAHNLRRNIILKISERRLEAYASLWAEMVSASPTRIKLACQPLTRQERFILFRKLQNWYYMSGNGMLLKGKTRDMFFQVKDNLVCDTNDLKPDKFRDDVLADDDEADSIRGARSIEQLSLLRTRMKADIGIFGKSYHGGLSEDDIEFLKSCGENPKRKPWLYK